MEQVVFTEAAILELLAQIDELREYDIALSSDGDTLDLVIGDSEYSVKLSDAEEIEVSPEALEVVDDINEDIFEDIESGDFDSDDAGDIDDMEDIEGGIIKDGIKSLLLGGAIRMAAKHGAALLK